MKRSWSELRKRASGEDRDRHWKSLEELADTEEFRAFVDDEFPHRTPDWNDPESRRRFLKLMGSSLALAGAAACTKQPIEEIVPYVHQPPEFTPGKRLYYATAMSPQGIGTGLLVESHLGRPTKIEGNDLHPASLGATDGHQQGSVLSLYDPDRSQAVLHNRQISTWGSFLAAFAGIQQKADANGGQGIRILTGTVGSPTLGALFQELQARYPRLVWHQYEAAGRHSERAASLSAWDAPVTPVYHFDRATTIVSLDADFFSFPTPGHLRYARDYTERRRRATRRATNGSVEPTQLYAIESSPTLVGAMAENTLRLSSGGVTRFAAQLANRFGIDVQTPSPDEATAQWLNAIAAELEQHRGASLIVPGEFQPPEVHAAAHALNQALGNQGQTVTYIDRIEVQPVDELASIRQLAADMRAGKVDALLMLGTNPVYDAPADLNFLDAMQKVGFRAHLGSRENETAYYCHWHIPEAHYLESWGDARAYDGTASIVQPLIEPIYGGKSQIDLLNVLLDDAGRSAHDTVRDYWFQQRGLEGSFDEFWRKTLHDGVIPGTAFAGRTPPPPRLLPFSADAEPNGDESFELNFRPDPVIRDESDANNGWLQELPETQTKVTWDNAVWLGPRTAERLGLETGSMVELTTDAGTIAGPVWVLPGQPDRCLTVHLGYGRKLAGRLGNGVGFDVNRLRTSTSPWRTTAQLRARPGKFNFATTQDTQTMWDREPVRLVQLTEYLKTPDQALPPEPPEPMLFPEWPYTGHKWGMSIDLNSCIGCQACMVACQAENNIAVVGKEQVAMGRHMNWIRVDRYYQGSLDTPNTYYQPVPCMHCETAPCELVCPTGATNHSEEGLNQMVYNRCVGTRYCSNNCPYKVRRFNFYLYSDWNTESLKGVRNPDVTVRSRGVMEKCTYCIQRIERARIDAKISDRELQDGDIVTACQQACPAQAIVFGDLNDPNSRVSRLQQQPRNYGLLEDLDTRPRTTYLAKLRNPNPALDGPDVEGKDE